MPELSAQQPELGDDQEAPVATRPFRFGVGPAGLTGHPPHSTESGWAVLARRLEDLGYSALNVGDHLDDRLAPLPALAVASAATTKLRLGTFLLSNDYRHPAVLAKEFATVDALSSGRLEAGIGAGWLAEDYERAGIPFDRPGRRIERLAEAVSVIKALLAEEVASFAGTHYRVSGLPGMPRPASAPRPPIVLGGGGRRILTLAAREADIVAFNVSLLPGRLNAPPGRSASAESVAQRVAWVREAAGDRYQSIESQVYIHVVRVCTDRAAAAADIGARFDLSPTEVLESPHLLVGTVDEIVDDLLERRDKYGFSYIGISAAVIDDFAPVVARLAGQ